ncbi:probable 28S ribosomal protein S10, mitochondrial isoform X1 [Scyliorhinus canicula]|uniref:probable 28S ribosomal protein S10, mitochondrial isoform X1 n=1 Tax=Scyliorhinus canicula TaxID=7830 RepID=UPI0018F5C7C4|nr:probable 28S ribosomal protein S10, mitochondrial isoform X1 [Scyliorhinus canicula]XP_038668286.1 probable 28S ribosomal protein S10, mitochondrial isoform X1 [Scyliorhinus canicula]
MAAAGLCRRLFQVNRIPVLHYAGHNMITIHFCSKRPTLILAAGIHLGSPHYTTAPLAAVTDEPDALYKKISVLVKGHDKTVLDSYEYFATFAAKELNIIVDKVYEPARKIERMTLLKSVHIFKKHRVQYEMRTYYKCIEIKHLTGSTASVYLEYIQRNLAEGLAMEVTKTMLEKLPEHIKEPVWSMHSSTNEGKPDS